MFVAVLVVRVKVEMVEVTKVEVLEMVVSGPVVVVVLPSSQLLRVHWFHIKPSDLKAIISLNSSSEAPSVHISPKQLAQRRKTHFISLHHGFLTT